MKNKLLFSGFILLFACEQKSKPAQEVFTSIPSTTPKSFFKDKIWIDGINKEDFSIRERGDTIFYTKQSYEGIEGKNIKFNKATFEKIEAEINYEIGLLQYTTDDVPAYPLGYTKKSIWVKLAVEDSLIKIPAFYKESDYPVAFEVLGFRSNKELLNWIIAKDFNKIKAMSLHEQTKFYKSLLKEKYRYKKCCPEYIEQAENFLKTPKKEFNSINKLGLEQNFQSMTIEIKGQLKSGKEFHKFIIGE